MNNIQPRYMIEESNYVDGCFEVQDTKEKRMICACAKRKDAGMIAGMLNKNWEEKVQGRGGSMIISKRYTYGADIRFSTAGTRKEVYKVFDTKDRMDMCECYTQEQSMIIAKALNYTWQHVQDEDAVNEMGG